MTAVEKYIHTHLRHNIFVNLLDGGTFGLALGFASFGTILPLFVASMTNSATLIGLVPAIHSAGWLLPQLFMASHTARLRRCKRMVMLATIHERLPFLGLAIIALFLPKIGTRLGLTLTFTMLVWQGLGGGITANAWTSMISKIIPPEMRGAFFGAQSAVLYLFISGAAVCAGYLLNWLDPPFDFTACFLAAVFFFILSWLALNLTREPEGSEKMAAENQAPFWRNASRILKQDVNFNWFLAARFLSQFATMGFAFYIVYALRRFNMNEVTAGYFTATLTISQTLANVGMGWLGDRIGHRWMLILGAAAAMSSSALAWLASSLAWFFPIFLLSGLANVSMWTISMAMTVNFSSEADRPFYIGLSQTLTAPATIIAPLIGGWIADTSGFTPTFAISTILSIALIGILFLRVKDPRKHTLIALKGK